MQKPQATCGFAERKERKNEKGDIRFYTTIIKGKCEDNKWKVIKKVLSWEYNREKMDLSRTSSTIFALYPYTD